MRSGLSNKTSLCCFNVVVVRADIYDRMTCAQNWLLGLSDCIATMFLMLLFGTFVSIFSFNLKILNIFIAEFFLLFNYNSRIS